MAESIVIDNIDGKIYKFTNGSKYEAVTGAGSFCGNTLIENIFKLIDYNSVLQTQILQSIEGAKWVSVLACKSIQFLGDVSGTLRVLEHHHLEHWNTITGFQTPIHWVSKYYLVW